MTNKQMLDTLYESRNIHTEARNNARLAGDHETVIIEQGTLDRIDSEIRKYERKCKH